MLALFLSLWKLKGEYGKPLKPHAKYKNDMWRNGGSGGNFSTIPPQAPLPPCCVIKIEH